MYCSKCGKENNNNSNFCIYCGERLKINELKKENKINERTKIEELEIRQNTNGNVLYILGALLLVIGGFIVLFMKYRTFVDMEIFGTSILVFYGFKIIALVGIIFFGYICIYYIKRASEGTPLVIVNKEGIIDNSSAIAVGFIPWENIGKIYIKSTLGNKFIHLNLKTKIKNRNYVDITLKSTGISPENFLQQILEYRKAIEK